MKNDKERFIERLSKDLGITKSEEEKNEGFIIRLMYSALSIFIKFFTARIDTMGEVSGISRLELRQKTERKIKSFCEISTEFRDWMNVDERDTVKILIERMINVGEIEKKVDGNSVEIADYKEAFVENNIIIFKGISTNKFYMSGIASMIFQENDIKKNDLEKKLDIFFNYNIEKRKKRYLKYIDSEYTTETKLERVEVFNKRARRKFSGCWEENKKLVDNEITLGKENKKDYMFIKLVEGKVKRISVREYDRDLNEVYRYMYELKATTNNYEEVYIKKAKCGKYIYVRLNNSIPISEMRILESIAWPVEDLTDYRFIMISSKFEEYVKKIFYNLQMKVVEK